MPSRIRRLLNDCEAAKNKDENNNEGDRIQEQIDLIVDYLRRLEGGS